MHIKPFPAIYPKLDFLTSPDSFFGSIREEFPEYFESGFFTQSKKEALYVYQIRSPRRHYTGLVACTEIRDFLEGHIRPHEHTMPEVEQKQMQLMLRRKATVKPVLLTYPRVTAIDEWINDIITSREPFFSITLEEEEHQEHLLWEIKEPASIRNLQELFASKVPNTYIADGHHRTSTMALMYERHRQETTTEDYSLLLCAFFPSSELEILEFNRVVEGLDECSPTWFMARIAQLFEIEILAVPEKPRRKHELVMLINREWYRLRWKQEVLDEYRGDRVILDTVLLNEKVLRDILHIEDERTDGRVEYIEGPKGLDGLRRLTVKSDTRVGFCLYPILLEDLIRLVDDRQVLPPKSTWFEPRIKNGLIVKGF